MEGRSGRRRSRQDHSFPRPCPPIHAHPHSYTPSHALYTLISARSSFIHSYSTFTSTFFLFIRFIFVYAHLICSFLFHSRLFHIQGCIFLVHSLHFRSFTFIHIHSLLFHIHGYFFLVHSLRFRFFTFMLLFPHLFVLIPYSWVFFLFIHFFFIHALIHTYPLQLYPSRLIHSTVPCSIGGRHSSTSSTLTHTCCTVSNPR